MRGWEIGVETSGVTQNEHEGNSQMRLMFYIFIGFWVKQVFAFVKTRRTHLVFVHFIFVNFTCKIELKINIEVPFIICMFEAFGMKCTDFCN